MGTTLKDNLQPTSVAVLMINAQGMLITVQGQDYFLSYNRVPWLRDARISSVLNVRMSGPRAIEWPDLDVDLEIESLRHPERYPLIINTATDVGCLGLIVSNALLRKDKHKIHNSKIMNHKITYNSFLSPSQPVIERFFLLYGTF